MRKVNQDGNVDIPDGRIPGEDLESSCLQNLSYEQIRTLKNDTLSWKIKSEDLIEMLIRNNKSFNQKSSFAQQKYISKKINK